MRLSVVIPVLDGMPYLSDQLKSVVAQEVPWPWEVVVVDNGSTDGSVEAVVALQERIPNLRLVRQPARGKPFALNRGVEVSAGEVLVFLDQDDQIAPGYLLAMGRALEHHGFVAARLESETLNPEWIRQSRPLTQEASLGDPFGYLPCATGCSMGIRREVFREVGGFDPTIAYCDDVDLSWRVQLGGEALSFVPEAVVRYRHRDRLVDIFSQARAYGTAGPALYKRYRDRGMPRRSLPRALRFHAAALYRLLSARSKSDLASCAFLFGFRLGVVEGCVKNRVMYL